MLHKLKSLLGFGPKVNYAELLKNGATIVDVRTKGEYKQGHIKDSQNVPLNTLASHKQLRKDKPVITCCASGVRSASAKSILKSNGYNEVYNGGSWTSLQKKITKEQ